MEEADVEALIWSSGNYLGVINLSYYNKKITLDSINKEISSLLQENNINLPA